MLSVVIATDESERTLVPTLTALVPGATAGLVREVIIADPGSRDATAEVADVAGCELIVSDAPLAARLAQAAQSARGPWLLFLKSGAVPQAGWIEETSRFIEEASLAGELEKVAAVFRAVSPSLAKPSAMREALALLTQAAGLSRRASHGLLIGRTLFCRLRRDEVAAKESEADMVRNVVRRLGRRRVVTLQCGAVSS
jgi:glycosyltransferase involved in cell wall biosynthesis